MTTLAQRMTQLFEEKEAETGKSRPELMNEVAAKCGIKAPSVYNWLDGTTKRLQGVNLMHAAQYFNVNMVWLDSGKGKKKALIDNIENDQPSPSNEEGVSGDVYATIKELRNELGAGGTAILREFDEVAGERAYRRDWLQKEGLHIEKLRILRVKGDSMVPYVFHGNKVLINTAETRVIDGEHYAIRVGDEPKIKRLFTQGDGKIRVESYNAPVDHLAPGNDFEILGLVVDRGGTSRYRA